MMWRVMARLLILLLPPVIFWPGNLSNAQIIRHQINPPLPVDSLPPIQANNASSLVKLAVFNNYDTRGRPNHLLSMAFSSDDSQVTLHSAAGLAVWDLATGEEMATLAGDYLYPVYPYTQTADLEVGPDNRYLLSWHPNYHPTLQIWNLAQGDVRNVLATETDLPSPYIAGGEGVAAATFLDGDEFALLRKDGRLEIRTLSDGLITQEYPACPPNRPAAFSLDGRLLACGDENIALIDVREGQIVRTLANDLQTEQLKFSPDGHLLVAYHPTRAIVWQTPDGQALAEYAFETPITRALVAGDGTLITHAPDMETANSAIRIWDAAGELRHRLPLEGAEISDMQLNQRGNLLAIVDWKGELTLWAAPECALQSEWQVNLREGPGTNYPVARLLNPGLAVVADGQTVAQAFTWWRLTDGNWVREDVVMASPGCQDLPLIQNLEG
jgi:hypothetical protein